MERKDKILSNETLKIQGNIENPRKYFVLIACLSLIDISILFLQFYPAFIRIL